jgi:plastocyanin
LAPAVIVMLGALSSRHPSLNANPSGSGLVLSGIERGAIMKRVLILVTALALVVGACSSEDGGSATTAGGSGGERVEIADFAFSPDTLTVPVGTMITWENTDSVTHTSTSDDGVWDSDRLGTGDEFSFTFDEAGTFSYFCEIHPSMRGSIVVEG